jgi:hypothetical protein
MMANRHADREQIDAKLKDLKEDTKSSQAEMRSILDAWITDIKDAQKKTTACQEMTGANPEKMETNPEEKGAIVERQVILNEEAAIHSLRECRRETMACRETTEARLGCEDPNSADIKACQETTAYHEATEADIEKTEPDPRMM